MQSAHPTSSLHQLTSPSAAPNTVDLPTLGAPAPVSAVSSTGAKSGDDTFHLAARSTPVKPVVRPTPPCPQRVANLPNEVLPRILQYLSCANLPALKGSAPYDHLMRQTDLRVRIWRHILAQVHNRTAAWDVGEFLLNILKPMAGTSMQAEYEQVRILFESYDEDVMQFWTQASEALQAAALDTVADASVADLWRQTWAQLPPPPEDLYSGEHNRLHGLARRLRGEVRQHARAEVAARKAASPSDFKWQFALILRTLSEADLPKPSAMALDRASALDQALRDAQDNSRTIRMAAVRALHEQVEWLPAARISQVLAAIDAMINREPEENRGRLLLLGLGSENGMGLAMVALLENLAKCYDAPRLGGLVSAAQKRFPRGDDDALGCGTARKRPLDVLREFVISLKRAARPDSAHAIVSLEMGQPADALVDTLLMAVYEDGHLDTALAQRMFIAGTPTPKPDRLASFSPAQTSRVVDALTQVLKRLSDGGDLWFLTHARQAEPALALGLRMIARVLPSLSTTSASLLQGALMDTWAKCYLSPSINRLLLDTAEESAHLLSETFVQMTYDEALSFWKQLPKEEDGLARRRGYRLKPTQRLALLARRLTVEQLQSIQPYVRQRPKSINDLEARLCLLRALEEQAPTGATPEAQMLRIVFDTSNTHLSFDTRYIVQLLASCATEIDASLHQQLWQAVLRKPAV